MLEIGCFTGFKSKWLRCGLSTKAPPKLSGGDGKTYQKKVYIFGFLPNKGIPGISLIFLPKRGAIQNTSQNSPPGALFIAEKQIDRFWGETFVTRCNCFRLLSLGFTLFSQCFHPFHWLLYLGGQPMTHTNVCVIVGMS